MDLTKFFARLFGSQAHAATPAAASPDDRPSTTQTAETIADDDPRVAAGYQRLQAYWDAIGPSDSDLLTYLVNPQFQGAPAWPNARQAYRIVRPKDSLIIASDGLSDPFVGTGITDKQGFGCEVYIEAPELAGASFDDVRSSWAFALIELLAQNIAHLGGLSQHVAKYRVLSLELPLSGSLPPEWLSANGTAGCLINLPVEGRPARIDDMPFGPVDILCAKLLTPAELADIVAGNADARSALAERFNQSDTGHHSRLDRL